jgi:hypothetical protein
VLDYTPVGTISLKPLGPTTKFEPFKKTASNWGMRPSLDPDALREEAEASIHARDFKRALASLDVRAAETPEPPELKLLRGYALLQLDQRKEAGHVFASLLDEPNFKSASTENVEGSSMELRK